MHPKYPKFEPFQPIRHRGKIKFSWYRVYIKLTFINQPYSDPMMPMQWDDGYHNSYIETYNCCGAKEAKHIALKSAYNKYPIRNNLQYVATKASLLKRRLR